MTERAVGTGKNLRRLETQVLRGIDTYRDRAEAWVPRVTMEYLVPNGYGAQSRWLELRRPAPPGFRWMRRNDKWVVSPPLSSVSNVVVSFPTQTASGDNAGNGGDVARE
jgi:hypothetical protein